MRLPESLRCCLAGRGLSMIDMLVRGLLIPMLTASFALSQNIFGTFTGVITDPSGAVIPNVAVTITNTGTNAVVPSNH